MPTYEVKAPDGTVFDVTAPEGADQGAVLDYAKAQFAQMAAAKRKADADAYAGEDVRGMGKTMRFLGGAKHAWDRGALGLKGLVTDLTEEDKAQLRQGEAFRQEADTAAKLGDFAGDVAMTAAPVAKGMQALRATGRALQAVRGAGAVGAVAANPLVAAGGAGAAVGAATAPQDRARGAIGGAVGGALGEGVGRVLTRTLGGPAARTVTPEARQMMDEGVRVPFWKAVDSPFIRKYGESARAMPFVGTLMKGQEAAAMRDYNKTLVRQANPPVPVLNEAGDIVRWEAKPVTRVGQEGMRELNENFGKAYDALYRGRTIPVDDTFAREMDLIAQQTDAYLPGISAEVQGVMRRANDTLRAGTESTKAVSPILDASGKPMVTEQLGHAGVSSQNVKRALDEVNESITSAWRKGDEEKARALELVRDAISDLRLRGLPPQVQSMLKPVNEAYANYKLLQRASGSMGAVRNEGIVTPLQMTNAVKANDRTLGKSATTQGIARGQQEAQRAQRVLGSELPEVGPGTAEKLALMTGLAGMGWMAPTAAAGSLLLTRPGQRVMLGGYGWQQSLRDNPQRLADILRSAGVAAGN